MPNLRIGIPSKGRLADAAAELLKEAGLSFRRQDRSLFAKVKEMDIDICFLRTDDIPVMCAEGAIGLGITGGDLIEEACVKLTQRLSLGLGGCRLAICVPEDSPYKTAADLNGARIATSFPNITRNYLAEHGADCHTVELSGSVEATITLGVADGIVDLVETGSTLAANRLRILETIGSYETVLVQSDSVVDAQLADRVVRRLEGVVIARSYSLLEYNIEEKNLSAAEKITPGYSSPTVNKLEREGWYAVRAMVPRKEVIGIMEKLEVAGAQAILETAIQNCRL
ncbi:ATP phosphoribosyltransferase [Aeoliella sp. ICT_H6.2]|uniref:ATP phosphoribosyltransferase n=1 Tax=Aeoliella straminimaris TaxID=2954799 RepID=A0A9X2JFY9_9BACT|nr:ATP phosphoribosyltransferase [Aeoliella straminimaris]MCO6043827.1 ATP phosphoribosyltransferase [Aeoliella straminimaris]